MDAPLTPELQAKLARLNDFLTRGGALVVAYSGGVDSSFLAVAAHRVLGARMLAVTAQSPLLAPEELEEARELAARFGFPHRVIQTDELSDPRFQANPVERCYYCKQHLMDRLGILAAELPGARVALGANVDDLTDHRPGERAAKERGGVFPLREAGLTKAEVRAVSRAWGLPTADKPAAACLASRIPFGEPVTAEKLGQVAQGEAALRRLGLRGCRVRRHGTVARIEAPAAQLEAVLAQRKAVIEGLKAAGFVFVALDLEGFRSGSMHEATGRDRQAE